MDNKLLEPLLNLGLNEKEAKTYLACLALGSATIQEIAKKAGIKRTSIYNFIDRLVELGLISKTQKENHYYFLAESPEILKTVQQKNQTLLDKRLPDLTKLFQLDKSKTTFKYFRGRQGIRKIWKETLVVQNKELFWTTAHEATTKLVGKRFVENYIIELKKRGIKSKALRNYRQKSNQRFFARETLKPMGREAGELPPEMKLENSMVIFDNKVASFAPIEENYGFIIESKTFANTMRIFYKALWEIATPI